MGGNAEWRVEGHGDMFVCVIGTLRCLSNTPKSMGWQPMPLDHGRLAACATQDIGGASALGLILF